MWLTLCETTNQTGSLIRAWWAIVDMQKYDTIDENHNGNSVAVADDCLAWILQVLISQSNEARLTLSNNNNDTWMIWMMMVMWIMWVKMIWITRMILTKIMLMCMVEGNSRKCLFLWEQQWQFCQNRMSFQEKFYLKLKGPVERGVVSNISKDLVYLVQFGLVMRATMTILSK